MGHDSPVSVYQCVYQLVYQLVCQLVYTCIGNGIGSGSGPNDQFYLINPSDVLSSISSSSIQSSILNARSAKLTIQSLLPRRNAFAEER